MDFRWIIRISSFLSMGKPSHPSANPLNPLSSLVVTSSFPLSPNRGFETQLSNNLLFLHPVKIVGTRSCQQDIFVKKEFDILK